MVVVVVVVVVGWEAAQGKVSNGVQKEVGGRPTKSFGQVMDWIGGMGEGQKTPPSSMGAWENGVNG